MKTKLITTEQVNALKLGDIISRYHLDPKFEITDPKVFDENDTENIEVFCIQSINISKNLLGLISIVKTIGLLISPTDRIRLFKHRSDILSENIWWV
jgi:hypothetical protein